jgi:hypothetical protein
MCVTFWLELGPFGIDFGQGVLGALLTECNWDQITQTTEWSTPGPVAKINISRVPTG